MLFLPAVQRVCVRTRSLGTRGVDIFFTKNCMIFQSIFCVFFLAGRGARRADLGAGRLILGAPLSLVIAPLSLVPCTLALHALAGLGGSIGAGPDTISVNATQSHQESPAASFESPQTRGAPPAQTGCTAPRVSPGPGVARSCEPVV